jgi:hypothetical protein
VPDANVKLFADDTNLFIVDPDIVALNKKANCFIDQLQQWFIANKLSINIAKTCCMVFPSKNQNKIKIVIHNLEVQKVTSCKYLGVILDNELKWTEHIDSVCKKLFKLIGVFYKLRSKLPAVVLKSIYFAFVHPHILYGIEIYANTNPTYLSKLVKLNNRILRILQNRPLATQVISLYRKYNTLPIERLHVQQILVIAHKFFHHRSLLPDVFQKYFVINNMVHCHNTRTKEDIHVQSTSLSVGQKCLRYKIGTLWNSLPKYLKLYMSVETFKRKLKSYLLLDKNWSV